MKINEMIKEFINTHEAKVEIFQWAVVSSISSLLYSEYIKNIKQQQVPSRIIWVPQVRTINELLEPNSYLSNLLSESLIDFMIEKELFKKYADIPELIIFSEEDDNIELIKTIFDIYILPNIGRSLSETISKKFDLLNPDQKLIKESRDIDLFNRKNITDEQFDFLVNQTLLQLLILLPSIEKKQEPPTASIPAILPGSTTPATTVCPTSTTFRTSAASSNSAATYRGWTTMPPDSALRGQTTRTK